MVLLAPVAAINLWSPISTLHLLTLITGSQLERRHQSLRPLDTDVFTKQFARLHLSYPALQLADIDSLLSRANRPIPRSTPKYTMHASTAKQPTHAELEPNCSSRFSGDLDPGLNSGHLNRASFITTQTLPSTPPSLYTKDTQAMNHRVDLGIPNLQLSICGELLFASNFGVVTSHRRHPQNPPPQIQPPQQTAPSYLRPLLLLRSRLLQYQQLFLGDEPG
ncbi:hypothetical protein EDD85DRAFT_790132 [Armillaria nabsnona]|nr:hypothetical protein EDD85DRAFT_790132 [Armillaria nabsnona]